MFCQNHSRRQTSVFSGGKKNSSACRCVSITPRKTCHSDEKKIKYPSKKRNKVISLQDSIGRRRDALWAIHPALVSLQEEEDLKNEKKLEEKGEDGEVKEDKEEEKHLERIGEKVEEGPEEKEKREVCVNVCF